MRQIHDQGESVAIQSQLTDQDFEGLRRLVTRHTGISVGAGKRQLLFNRLNRRLQCHGLSSFGEYCELIDSGRDRKEIEVFINAVTTNLTAFFREPHHFELLRQSVIPQCLTANKHSQRLRIWSAGCSTGEEAYCLAITVYEAIRNIADWDVLILATDLDTSVLSSARAGVYPNECVAKVPPEYRKKWFTSGSGEYTGKACLSPKLKQIIRFRQLNLMDEWPMRGVFDVVFCRNVVIYFDKATQAKLFNRMADQMAPGGHLFIGHSESLHNVTDRFSLLGKTTYRKVS